MGVLTDILIADVSEAERIAESISPLNTWPGIDAKGHNDVTLGALFCLLQGKDYDWENLIEFPLLTEKSVEGPWVFKIPDELLISLSQISDTQLPEIIFKWMETGELGYISYQVIENSLLELRALAKQALLQEKDVLMWICL